VTVNDGLIQRQRGVVVGVKTASVGGGKGDGDGGKESKGIIIGTSTDEGGQGE
jgi:hypothetical protein